MGITLPDDITWAQFLSNLTRSPLKAISDLCHIFANNFAEKWFWILLTIFCFWLARKIVFVIINIVVPRSIDSSVPRWAETKKINKLHSVIFKNDFESRRLYRAHTIISLTKSLIDPIMLFIAVLVVFGQLGLTTSTQSGTWIVASSTVALGLASQGVIKDILAGITIVVGDVYAVGDYVDVQFGANGIVKHIGLRLTALEGTDGTIWFVRHSEISKIGNRTASHALAMTDITLTWNEENKHITIDDLKFAEITLDNTVKELAETLEGVRRVARDMKPDSEEDEVSIESIAAVVPDLVPTISGDKLYDLKSVTEEDDTGEHLKVEAAIKSIPGKIPLFTNVETLGLVNSSVNTVTLRLRITLPPNASRSQAISVLRRAVFEEFIKHDITVSFDDVPEGGMIPVLPNNVGTNPSR